MPKGEVARKGSSSGPTVAGKRSGKYRALTPMMNRESRRTERGWHLFSWGTERMFGLKRSREA